MELIRNAVMALLSYLMAGNANKYAEL